MKKIKTLRITLFIVLFAIFGVPAFSQVKFGVKADVGLNNPKFNNDALKVKNLTSYSVGPSVEMMFPLPVINLGIEASLLYNDNRMTVSKLGEGNWSKDVSNRYLNLPINLKLKFGSGLLPIKYFITAGPYIGYRISGDKIDFDEINKDIKGKSFQAGANVGIGLELLKLIQVGINYRAQLTDNYGVNEPKWKNPLNDKTNTWSIAAAIYF